MVKVSGVKCKRCGDIVYSRARHDMRGCTCGSIFVDGGFDYMKVSGEPENMDFVQLEVDATKPELYNDWGKDANKYGLVRKGESLWK